MSRDVKTPLLTAKCAVFMMLCQLIFELYACCVIIGELHINYLKYESMRFSFTSMPSQLHPNCPNILTC